MKKLIAVAVAMGLGLSFNAAAISADCGCIKTPTGYDKTQDTKIAGKVDNSVFRADQERQDKAAVAYQQAQQTRDAGQDTIIQQAHEKADYSAVRLDGVESKNVSQDQHIEAVQASAQSGNVKADKLAVRADQTERNLAVTDGRSINNAVRLDGVEQVNVSQDQQLADETSSRIDGDQRNSQGIANANNRIDAVADQGNRNFRQLNQRIDRLDKRLDAGVSSALASAGIPQVTGEQRFTLGAAVGGYESGSALAVGFSSRVSQAVVVKAAVTTDNQQGFGYNAGLSWGW